MRRGGGWRNGIAVLAMMMAVPATAQFTSGSYGFIKAVKDRDGTKAQELLDKPSSNIVLSRDTNGETALHIVTKRRDLTWLQFMLAKGAQPDARDNQGLTALADAAQLGWVEGVQQLLDIGASVDLADDRGETPLILATQARSAVTVRALLDHGADAHATDSVAGMSALDYATRDGRMPDVLKMLQSAKPVVKKQISGPKR